MPIKLVNEPLAPPTAPIPPSLGSLVGLEHEGVYRRSHVAVGAVRNSRTVDP